MNQEIPVDSGFRGERKLVAETFFPSSGGVTAAVKMRSSLLRFTFLNALAVSIWYRTCWAPLLLLASGEHRKSLVGILAAVNGACELVAAALGGWAADHPRVGRVVVVTVALWTGLAAILLLLCAVATSALPLTLLALGQAAYGAFVGLSLSSTEALLADSTPHGQRDALYGVKVALTRVAPLAGCGASVGLFLWFGDAWTLGILRVVMLCGLLLHAVTLVQLLVSLSLWSAVDTPEAVVLEEGPDPHQHDEASDATETHGSSEEGDDASPSALTLPQPRQASDARRRWACVPAVIPLRRIPALLVLHDTVLVIGSGLTTMYFGLFLMEAFHVSPIGLAVVNAAAGVSTGAVAVGLSRHSARVGRCVLVVASKSVGWLLLLFIAVVSCRVDSWGSTAFLVSLAYCLRFGAMNGADGVGRSLLMDIVPRSERARWSAAESLQSASWSGTGYIGGYLVDRYGYAAAFRATLVLHGIAILLLSPAMLTDDRPTNAVLHSDEASSDEMQVASDPVAAANTCFPPGAEGKSGIVEGTPEGPLTTSSNIA